MKDYRAENVVGALVLTLSDVLLKVTQVEAPANISAAGLTLIGHIPGISIRALSLGLGLSHAGTVRLVDRMSADGLVERARSETDGRAVALYLTIDGKKREQMIHKSRRAALSTAMSSLSRDEYASLAQISEKLITSILKDEEHALKVCRLCDSQACTSCPVDAELRRRSQA